MAVSRRPGPVSAGLACSLCYRLYSCSVCYDSVLEVISASWQYAAPIHFHYRYNYTFTRNVVIWNFWFSGLMVTFLIFSLSIWWFSIAAFLAFTHKTTQIHFWGTISTRLSWKCSHEITYRVYRVLQWCLMLHIGGTDIKCTYSSHTAWVSCVAWSSTHSHHFISGSYDQLVKLWDTRWYALHDLMVVYPLPATDPHGFPAGSRL